MTLSNASRLGRLGIRYLLCVLLVEDNPGDVILASTFLSEADGNTFEICHVPSLARAIAQLSQGPVDAVLLDLGLPDAQGLDTLTRLKSVAGRAAVIVLSGGVNLRMHGRALELGADDVLSKNEALTQMLGHCVSTVIGRSRSLEQHRTLERAPEAVPDAIIVATGIGKGDGFQRMDIRQ